MACAIQAFPNFLCGFDLWFHLHIQETEHNFLLVLMN